jgi:nucleolar pre-ribosomal-associated protein 1
MSKVHSKIPQKKEKPSAEVKRFADAHEIRAALQDDSAETLRESLIILRNQLTIRHNDTQISPQDERLILAQTWLGSDPSAGRVFAIWETATLVSLKPSLP